MERVQHASPQDAYDVTFDIGNLEVLLADDSAMETLTDSFNTSSNSGALAADARDVETSDTQGLPSTGPTGFVHVSSEHHCSTQGMTKDLQDCAKLERPQRVAAILRKMTSMGLVSRCTVLSGRMATMQELERVHEASHTKDMEELACHGQRTINETAALHESVYLTSSSFDSACLACGSVLELVGRVTEGSLANGLAAVRPPGHHAETGNCCGFCVFNNVAVAAKTSQLEYGVGKVLIVDWDVHHGNGTQRMFENDSSILYFSVHRYDYGTFFPGSKDAAPDVVGCGPGAGCNVNVAWNIAWKDEEGMGDNEYLAAWQCVLLPIALDFQPQLILVSAGFDAARGDVGKCSVTPSCFAQLTRMLQEVCPKVVLVLEGGYDLNVTADCFVACAQALLGDQLDMQSVAKPKDEARLSIERTLRAHRPFWSSLQESSAGSNALIPILGSRSPGGVKESPLDLSVARRSQARKHQRKESKMPSGVNIATRNASQNTWKADVKKLEREEAVVKAKLQKIDSLRQRSATKCKLTAKELVLMENEESLRWEMKEVLSELNELRALSKADVVRMYSGAQ